MGVAPATGARQEEPGEEKMKGLIPLVFFGLFAVGAIADDTDDVIALVQKHWEARNAADYDTQYNLSSKLGVLGANSNGTFFTAPPRGTVEDLKEGLSNIKKSDVAVRYPEAHEISEGVILARYYLEGQIEFADGTRVADYRTRVTQVWVREDGEWKYRSWHFSPLHQGGVHRD